MYYSSSDKSLIVLRTNIVIFLLIFSFTICSSCDGFVSGYFKLDPQSRVPAWFKNKKKIPREKLDFKIIIYETTTSSRGKVKIIVSSNGIIISEVEGLCWYHPKSFKKAVPAEPPSWTIIEINETREVYEQSERNDILKIVDEPPPV